MAKISIIVPVYNSEKDLPTCLDSIINQTMQDIEVIIVDDGSTDNSLKICQEYAKNDKRILIHSQKNKGVSAARNMGLKLATGDFIGFVDSDDYIEPDTYSIALEHMSDDVDVIIWDVNLIFNDNELDNYKNAYYDYYNINTFGKRKITLEDKLYLSEVLWNKLFRKSIITEHNLSFPVGKIFEDACFWYEYTLWVKNIDVIPYKLYNYNIKGSTLTGKTLTTNKEYELDRLYIFEKVFDYIYENNLLKENKDLVNMLYFIYYHHVFVTIKDKNILKKGADKLLNKIINVYKEKGI